MSRYLFPAKTHATAEQVHNRFRAADPTLSPAALLLLVSHWGIETGDGSSMKNYNIGGAKAKPNGPHDWTFFATRDPAGPDDPRIVLHSAPSPARQQEIGTPGAAPMNWSERVTCFRAYESLDAACRDHLLLLQTKFPRAWEVLQSDNPDPREYARALKSAGYFAAPLDDYLDPKTGKVVQGYASVLAWRVRKYQIAVLGWSADA